MRSYTVTAMTASVPVREFVETCVDVEKFLKMCRMCPNYGNRWACPPLTVDPMSIWSAYDTLRIYARILTPAPTARLEPFLDAFRQEKIDLSRQVLALENRIPGSRSMAASTCILCNPCPRSQGKPCIHPEQVRYSIEALGGDVGLMMERYLGKPLQWIKDGQLPAYMTLAAGLLIPETAGSSVENQERL